MQVQIFLEAGIPPDQVAAFGALAEQAGIQTLWTSSFPGKREPLLCLSALAATRPGIRMGAVPLSPYETHPLKMAESLLTLNELSGGRVAATIGGIATPVTLTIRAGNGRVIAEYTAPLLCTHFGVSGPVVLDASRHLLAARAAGDAATGGHLRTGRVSLHASRGRSSAGGRPSRVASAGAASTGPCQTAKHAVRFANGEQSCQLITRMSAGSE